MGTRAVTFATIRLIFCRVNAIFLADSPEKIRQAWSTSEGGPGLKSGPRTRVPAIFYFFDLNVLYNPRKIMLNVCWSLSAGDFYFKSAFPCWARGACSKSTLKQIDLIFVV